MILIFIFFLHLDALKIDGFCVFFSLVFVLMQLGRVD